MTADRAPSELLQYLPAIYREDPFLGRFLLAFEQVLIGPAAGPFGDGTGEDPQGLEGIIDRIPELFGAHTTPERFLPWLARWVALTVRADFSLELQRRLIGSAVSHYLERGTVGGLVKTLTLFTGGTPDVVEPDATPHAFEVTVRFAQVAGEEHQRKLAIAHALIQLEKPVHTSYTLYFDAPSMRVGLTSHVGKDTVLGTERG